MCKRQSVLVKCVPKTVGGKRGLSQKQRFSFLNWISTNYPKHFVILANKTRICSGPLKTPSHEIHLNDSNPHLQPPCLEKSRRDTNTSWAANTISALRDEGLAVGCVFSNSSQCKDPGSRGLQKEIVRSVPADGDGGDMNENAAPVPMRLSDSRARSKISARTKMVSPTAPPVHPSSLSVSVFTRSHGRCVLLREYSS